MNKEIPKLTAEEKKEGVAIGEQIAGIVIKAPRVGVKLPGVQKKSAELPTTSIANAFQKTIRERKEAAGTYAGNPKTPPEIKKDLAKLGVTTPEKPVAGPVVERKPAPPRKDDKSTFAEILPEYVLRKKIANAEKEITSLELRLRNAKGRGDADTAIWANARIIGEKRKIEEAKETLFTHPNVTARNKKAPVAGSSGRKPKPKTATYNAGSTTGDPDDWKTEDVMGKDPFDGHNPKKPSSDASNTNLPPIPHRNIANNPGGSKINTNPFINTAVTANTTRQGNTNFGETPYTVKTTVEFPGDNSIIEHNITDTDTVRLLLGTHSPEELIAMIRSEQANKVGEEKRRIEVALEVLGDGDKTPSSRARITELEARLAELDAVGKNESAAQPQETPVSPDVPPQQPAPEQPTQQPAVPITPEQPTQQPAVPITPESPPTPEVQQEEMIAGGGGGRPPEGPPAGVAFQREVAETFERERTTGQRTGSRLMERLKGFFTLGWWEVHVAEKFRVATRDVGRDISAQSRLIRQEEGLLSEEDARDEANRMRELFRIAGLEAPTERQYEQLSQIVTSEKVANNRGMEDRIVSDALRSLEERLRRTKTYGGENMVAPERLRAVEERIRNSIRAQRRGQADEDILNFTRRIRGALDPEWYKRYVAAGVEMVLGAVALKWVATYAVGNFFGGFDPTTTVEFAKEATRNLKDTIWGEAKRILIEKGVPAPVDSQIMELSKVIATDSKVGVSEWNIPGTPLDVHGKAGMLLHVGRALAMAARIAGGV